MDDARLTFWMRAVSRLLLSRAMPESFPRVASATAERFREILPRDDFQVSFDERAPSIQVVAFGAHGDRGMMIGPDRVSLRLPLPSSLRLRIYFENEATGLQEFGTWIRVAAGSSWPRPPRNRTPQAATPCVCAKLAAASRFGTPSFR